MNCEKQEFFYLAKKRYYRYLFTPLTPYTGTPDTFPALIPFPMSR